MTVTSLCAGEQAPHESLQCVQCLITFSDARSKERHVRNSHRDEYKRYLQQVGNRKNNSFLLLLLLSIIKMYVIIFDNESLFLTEYNFLRFLSVTIYIIIYI